MKLFIHTAKGRAPLLGFELPPEIDRDITLSDPTQTVFIGEDCLRCGDYSMKEMLDRSEGRTFDLDMTSEELVDILLEVAQKKAKAIG